MQLPNRAVAGDTVTERIVGTTLSETAMLAPRPVAWGDALTAPHPSSDLSALIASRARSALRLIVSLLALGGAMAGGRPLDPDLEAGSAQADDGDREQQQPARGPPRPRWHPRPQTLRRSRADAELQLGGGRDTEIGSPDRDRYRTGGHDVTQVRTRPCAVRHVEFQRNPRCLMRR